MAEIQVPTVMIPSSPRPHVAACVGGKDAQSKLACPISLGETVRGSVVKYDRREIEEMMKSDQERPGHTARTAGTCNQPIKNWLINQSLNRSTSSHLNLATIIEPTSQSTNT